MSSLNVGIIGCGFATTVLHAPLVLSTPGLKLVAISSSDESKVRSHYGQTVKVVKTPEELFAIKEIDLVVIPTPNQSHCPLAIAALEAGKHVVVDKPFTITLKEAQDVVNKAKQKGKLLSVFQNRRWDSDFLTLRQVLADDKLGRI